MTLFCIFSDFLRCDFIGQRGRPTEKLRQFVCNKCHRRYTRKDNFLIRHVRIVRSDNVPAFICPICPHHTLYRSNYSQNAVATLLETFITNSQYRLLFYLPLMEHDIQLIQEVECNSKLLSLLRFAVKRRKSDQERPFSCPNCSRAYLQKKNLKRHIRYECNLEPTFACSRCDYRAFYQSSLKQHIVNIHKLL